MLKKMVKEITYQIIFDNEFLMRFGTVLLKDSVFRSMLEGVASEEVKKSKNAIVINVGDGDIIVVPAEGMTDAEFKSIVSLLPKDKRVGVIAADNVKILRLT